MVHPGGVTCLDVHAKQMRVVTAGGGALAVHDLARLGESPGAAAEVAGRLETGGLAGFRDLRWASYDEVVTASTIGGLQVWDVRGRVAGSRVSPGEWGSGGGLCAVDIHPGRPHVCLTGAEDGTVAVWDLRFGSRPVSARAGAGEVWGVRFSGSSGAEMPGGGSLSAGYLCTGEGAVGLVHTAPGGALEVRAVAQESGSAVGMDVRGTGSAEDVACVTSHECLTFLHSRVTAA